jgi:photosystem II stability/assembly factor-like uncharacterized protein
MRIPYYRGLRISATSLARSGRADHDCVRAVGSGQARGLPQALVVGTAAAAGIAAGLLLIGIASNRLIHPTPIRTARAATPSSSPHVIAAQPVMITAIQMASPTVGWGLGARADRPDEQVLRTADGGHHWTDITPTAARNRQFIPYFLGTRYAWVLLDSGSRQNTVYRSADGGVTWTSGTPLNVRAEYGRYGPMGAQPIEFVDPLHGWMTFGFDGGDGIGVYATTDGGAHWQLRSLNIARPGASTPSALPSGCAKTGVTFSSVTRGWATAHCSSGRPFFYGTADGGRTWQALPLPAPIGYPADLFVDCACTSLPPDFSSANDGVLTFRNPDFVYATHDAGVSWLPLPLPSKAIADNPMFIDASEGFIAGITVDPATRVRSFDRLYVTHDGGQSWQGIKPNHELQILDFATPRAGWSLYAKGNAPPQLLITSDGGATWSVIQPVVDQATQSEQA